MYVIQTIYTEVLKSELTIKGRKMNSFDSSILSFHPSMVKHVDYSRTSGQIVNEIAFVIKPEEMKKARHYCFYENLASNELISAVER